MMIPLGGAVGAETPAVPAVSPRRGDPEGTAAGAGAARPETATAGAERAGAASAGAGRAARPEAGAAGAGTAGEDVTDGDVTGEDVTLPDVGGAGATVACAGDDDARGPDEGAVVGALRAWGAPTDSSPPGVSAEARASSGDGRGAAAGGGEGAAPQVSSWDADGPRSRAPTHDESPRVSATVPITATLRARPPMLALVGASAGSCASVAPTNVPEVRCAVTCRASLSGSSGDEPPLDATSSWRATSSSLIWRVGH